MKKTRCQSIKEHLLPILFFFGVAAIILNKLLFGKVYIEITGDHYFLMYTWMSYFKQMASRGLFALWNPYILCGHPFGTEALSNINFANILSIFFDTPDAWNIWRILHFALAGIFTWRYARIIGLNKISSVLAGFIFMLSPSIFESYIQSATFLLPLVLFFIEKHYNSSGYKWLLLASLAAALIFYNSNAQFVLYIFVFIIVYMVTRAASLKKKGGMNEILKTVGLFLLFTMGVILIQVLRLAEIASISHRQLLGAYKHDQLYPTHWITALFAYFFESPFRPDNFFFGRIESELVKNYPLLGNPRNAPYIGVLPLVLSIAFIMIKKRDFYKSFFGWSALGALLYVSLDKPLSIIYRYIPFFGSYLNQMPFSSRSYALYYFALSILAATALSLLFDNRENILNKAVNVSRVFVILSAVLGILLFILHIGVVFYKTPLLEYIKRIIAAHVSNNPAYSAGIGFYYNRAEQLYSLIKEWSNPANPSFWISALLIILVSSLLVGFRKNIINRKTVIGLSFGLIALDLISFNYKDISCVDKPLLKPQIPAIEFIKTKSGIFRTAPLSDIIVLGKEVKTDTILRPSTNLLYGISSPEGFQSLIIGRNVEMMKRYAVKTKNAFLGLIGEIEVINDRLADIMNIKYIVTSSGRPMREGYKRVYEDSYHFVYENISALPRTYAVFGYELLRGREDILGRLTDEDFAADRSVILEKPIALPLSPKPNPAKAKVVISNYQPHKVDISAEMPEGGIVVLVDSFYPGWKAYVDGKRTEILRANYCFRAVEVGKGRHTVSFVYDSDIIKIGLAVLAVTILAMIILFIM